MKKYTRKLATNNNFRFYCTCTPQMLMEGVDVELKMSFDQEKCKKYLLTKLQPIVENIQEFDLLIYLPGGIPFLNGTLNDVFSEHAEPKVKHNIYGVFTRSGICYNLDINYIDFSIFHNYIKKKFFSPICKSTANGLCDIACLIYYFIQKGQFSNQFHKIASSIIPFPPFSTCLLNLIENNYFTVRDFITITSTLHTYFNYLMNMSKPPEEVFEYTLKLCNIIMTKEEPQDIPIQEIDVKEKLGYFTSSVLDKSIQYIYFWQGDLVNYVVEYYKMDLINVDEINENQKNIFAFLSPKKYSIVRGKDHCYVCYPEGNLTECKYKIIDPIHNYKTIMWGFRELSHSYYYIESNDLSNFIQKDSIKQAIFICFDGTLMSSLDFCQYLTLFVRNLYNYNISCIQGLIRISQYTEIVCPLRFPGEDIDLTLFRFGKSRKVIHLWDTISLACDELVRNENEYKNAVKRIVVFSNEDKGSKINLKDVSCKLLNNKIIVDSIISNKTEKSKELTTLCHITGGYSLNPETIDEGFQLFDKTSLLDIESRQNPNTICLIEGNRRTKPKFMTPSILTDEFIQNCVRVAKLDKDIPNKFNNIIREDIHYSTPRHICCVNKNNSVPNPKKRRILRELQLASKVMDVKKPNYDPDLVIFPLSSSIEFWNVYLKGIEKTPYEGKWFNISVTFPQLYPNEPPIIQFLSIPYSMNVSYDGKFCFDYNPKMHIVDIIQETKQIFLFPNIECPLRIDALEVYKDNIELYWRKAKESTEIVGKNDFREFFPDHLILNDDVDDDNIFDVDRIPLYMRSQIESKNIKDPVLSSTGVYYERERLKELIRSNKNPICEITGRPLTDKLEDLDK